MPQYRKKTPPTPTTMATPTSTKRLASASRRKSNEAHRMANAAIGMANAPTNRSPARAAMRAGDGLSRPSSSSGPGAGSGSAPAGGVSMVVVTSRLPLSCEAGGERP
jgi:hypothetical protein